ncbi:MAG: substrate-binding domain-containing protein [Thermodesulfobacteriota bacterium]
MNFDPKQIAGICRLLVVFLLFTATAAAAAPPSLLMATTTSTDNTGLLDYLMPLFTKSSGIEVKWTATGTGKALALGQNCDVDVLMVHDPIAEKEYLEKGYGVDRREIMFNDFILIGPSSDPAAIRGKTAVAAFAAMRAKGAVFASRGDESGTHAMEKELWRRSVQTVPDKEAWYIQTGQGMLATIHVAEERNGYCLTDRGTYIKYEDVKGGDPRLKILVEGDTTLQNQYSVIAVNPKKCNNSKYDLVMKLSAWLAGAEGQKAIAGFQLLGKPLFTPNAK